MKQISSNLIKNLCTLKFVTFWHFQHFFIFSALFRVFCTFWCFLALFMPFVHFLCLSFGVKFYKNRVEIEKILVIIYERNLF